MFGLLGFRSWVLPIAAAAVVVLLPWLGAGPDVQRQVLLIAILALVVGGLNLSLGYAGELALGQVAIYAAGAYMAGYLGSHGVTDIALQLLASAGVAVVIGIATGVPGLRLGSWSLAMTSFFLVLLVPDIVQAAASQTGGAQGLTGIAPPTFFGATLSDNGYYVLVVAVTAGWFALLRNLVVSRRGTAFQVLRQSPVLASSLGVSVYATKLEAYALGALPAGIAGCFFANLDHYLSPGSFDFSLAVAVLAASIVGGSTSVYGAPIGAAILELGPQESSSFQQYALVAYGAFLVVGGIVLGGGLAGMCRTLVRRATRALGVKPGMAATNRLSEPLPLLDGVELNVEGVEVHFGGVRALRGVNLCAAPGKVTGVIGPNGSGKTTLLNVVCGYVRPQAGHVRVGDQVLDRLAPHRRARAGVARTFQTTSIPQGLSVAEVVRSGRLAAERRGLVATVLRLPSFRRLRARDERVAQAVMCELGIDALADRDAASLPMGTRRLVELARALASRPRVLLLDEVASGLDEAEVERLSAAIRRICRAGATVVLVEHNIGLVLEVADVVVALAEGEVIASGPPRQVEAHPRVLAEYLGLTTAFTQPASSTPGQVGQP